MVLMWIKKLVERHNIKKVEITFNPHVLMREIDRNLDIDNIVETIRNGKIVVKKSKRPDKLCFKRYFGKENKTYFVIVVVHKNYFEVITTWLKKGR